MISRRNSSFLHTDVCFTNFGRPPCLEREAFLLRTGRYDLGNLAKYVYINVDVINKELLNSYQCIMGIYFVECLICCNINICGMCLYFLMLSMLTQVLQLLRCNSSRKRLRNPEKLIQCSLTQYPLVN